MKWYNYMTKQEKKKFSKSNCCVCSRCNFNSTYSYSFSYYFVSKI